MKTYITCDFPGGGGPESLSSSGSAHVSSPFTYPRMFSLSMTICKKKSARDQVYYIWRLELGKVTNTMFLVKSEFLLVKLTPGGSIYEVSKPVIARSQNVLQEDSL